MRLTGVHGLNIFWHQLKTAGRSFSNAETVTQTVRSTNRQKDSRKSSTQIIIGRLLSHLYVENNHFGVLVFSVVCPELLVCVTTPFSITNIDN